ncbi:MAG: nucleotide sugar dehydrogenase [Candidatus Zixiibacteriota bacterium]
MKRRSSLPQITVVGGGYVGLATAVFLADKELPTTVLEKKPDRAAALSKGHLHFREPLLERTLKQTLRKGSIHICRPSPEAFISADYVFIAIDSADLSTGRMRLGSFEQMAQWIGGARSRRLKTIVLKSTNRIGFAATFDRMVNRPGARKKANVVVNPEFLREGYAYEDTSQPWRIIVGAKEKPAANALVRLYRSVYGRRIPVIVTDWESAELIKLGANVYLAHRLGFIHEMADFARMHDLDLEGIKQGIGLDPRIGLDYFEPGLGFGGSCLPKDCRLINSSESANKFEFLTAQTALAINERLLDNLVQRLHHHLGRLKGLKLALLGVAFKPEVDDTRNSQAVRLALKLKDRGATVVCYDPYLVGHSRVPDTNLPLENDITRVVKSATALIVGTAHREFRRLAPRQIGRRMARKLVCDCFNILNRKSWTQAGFEFI